MLGALAHIAQAVMELVASLLDRARPGKSHAKRSRKRARALIPKSKKKRADG